MEPSIWTSYFVDLEPEEMVVAFTGKGWFHAELSNEHSKILLDRGDPTIAGQRFRSFAADCGMSFPQGHLWLSVDIAGGDQAKIIAELKRWLDLYLGLGINAAVIHAGGRQLILAGTSPERVLELRLQALKELTDYVNGSDLTICLENTPSAPQAEDLLSIIKACGSSYLGICLDTGHLNLAGGRQAAFIRSAGQRLQALHLADNDGTADQHLMPYGRGTVRWEEVVPALREVGYHGLFNFEIPGERRCPLPVRLAKLNYLRAVTVFMLAS